MGRGKEGCPPPWSHIHPGLMGFHRPDVQLGMRGGGRSSPLLFRPEPQPPLLARDFSYFLPPIFFFFSKAAKQRTVTNTNVGSVRKRATAFFRDNSQQDKSIQRFADADSCATLAQETEICIQAAKQLWGGQNDLKTPWKRNAQNSCLYPHHSCTLV